MTINNYIKKRFILFSFTLIFIVILSISASYAFTYNKTDSINNNLEITYNLSNKEALPMDKNSGALYSPSNEITIYNPKDYTIRYELVLKRLDESSLELKYLYYSINGLNPKSFKSDTKEVVYEGIIKPNSTTKLDVKVWPGSDLIKNYDDTSYINLIYDIKEK